MKKYFYNIFRKVFTFGFDLLYHQFVWIYPFASWIVSSGLWDKWICEVLPMVGQGPDLELGCGRGILLEKALASGLTTFGLDESPQMLRESRRRIGGKDFSLIRGKGQYLPFADHKMLEVISTFPAQYIFEETTIMEIKRVISPKGRLIILLSAALNGPSIHHRLIRGGGKILGYENKFEDEFQKYQKHIEKFGFKVSLEIREVDDSKLYFLIAQPFK